uniref:DUF4739 domain-containing protein n=1 Tax=Trichuris muris TaxID=70415 RepID=A0A5S6QVH6_TRIMR
MLIGYRSARSSPHQSTIRLCIVVPVNLHVDQLRTPLAVSRPLLARISACLKVKKRKHYAMGPTVAPGRGAPGAGGFRRRVHFLLTPGAKEVDNGGAFVDGGNGAAGNKPFSADVLKPMDHPEGQYATSSLANVASGELFYPAGLVDRKLPGNVTVSVKPGSSPQRVVQVGRETVRIRLRGRRRRILSSDSSGEEDEGEVEKKEQQKGPISECPSEVKPIVSCKVVPLSSVTSERTLTTLEKREERTAELSLSVVSQKTGSSVDHQQTLTPLTDAPEWDKATEAEPLAAPSGRPVKSHRDQVLEQNSSDERIQPGASDQTLPTALSRPQNLLAGFQRVALSTADKDDGMSMAMASPENCQRLSRCLTSETKSNERGVAMFMRQRQRADKYTIDEETPRRTPLPRSFAPAPIRPASTTINAAQPTKIRPDKLLESVRAAANRREKSSSSSGLYSRRSTSVEPDRHRWTGIISPYDFAIGAPSPPPTSLHELTNSQAKSVRFMNGPAVSSNATEPLYIQCYDRRSPVVDYSRAPIAPPSQSVGANFNSLPRGWKAYKAGLKASSLR